MRVFVWNKEMLALDRGKLWRIVCGMGHSKVKADTERH